MKEDFWRFAGVFLFSLVIGIFTHQILLCLLAGGTLLLFWQYRLLKQMLVWLQTRDENSAPELPGIIDDICREIDYLRERQQQRSFKLSGYLKRFQDASAALPDALVILGEYGQIEWANNKTTEYLGIRWPLDNNQRITNLIRHPELSAFLNKTGRYAMQNTLQIEAIINPDIMLEFRMVPYGDKHKLLMARDITNIQRIDQMRKDFIANASHELRTPLTVILGYLESFSDDSRVPDALRTQVMQMRSQSERMQRLIDDLLTLSALESTDKQSDVDIVLVPDLLTSILKEAESLSSNMEHIFYLESDPDLWIRGNQRELYSAFSNLVFNAVQYTPAKGIIRIRWYADEQGAHFAVTDNGQGIAPEHIPRITERFYRVDKGRSREQGGTGLGLAIVKHVMARHGARLNIESQPGRGSTFRCDFPGENIIYKTASSDSSLSA